MHATARWTVRYGEELRFAGSDLRRPTRISVPTRHGRVPVHVYRPRRGSDASTALLGAYVHFHGGAFLMRYPEMDDFWCRYVAADRRRRGGQRRLPGRAVRRLPRRPAPVPRRRRVGRRERRGPRRGRRPDRGGRLQHRRRPGRLGVPAGPRPRPFPPRCCRCWGCPPLDLASACPPRRRADDLAVAARPGPARVLPGPGDPHARPYASPLLAPGPDRAARRPWSSPPSGDTLRARRRAVRRAAARGGHPGAARRDAGGRPLLPVARTWCGPGRRWR